jgi:hypothetical protein
MTLCDMTGEPPSISYLLDRGLEEFTVAPPELGGLKAAIARHE